MSNHVMSVDFFGNSVRAETQGNMVCINDLLLAGNKYRSSNGLSTVTMQQIKSSVGLLAYIKSASNVWGIHEDALMKVIGKGNKARTMAHISVAIYVAEQLSPDFHAQVIKTFIEGKLLEFRDLGGTEFRELNAAMDLYLPDRQEKDNKGVYIQTAIIVRRKLLGKDAVAGDWNNASVAQIHSRYELEKYLVKTLSMGLVKDWYHLKEIIERL